MVDETGSAEARERARVSARWAVRRGLAVFPLEPDGKAPAVLDWERRASADLAGIARWPRATTGYGIAAGRSGLYVVDLDMPKPTTPPAPEPFAGATCGLDVLLRLAAEAGESAPRETFTVRTGRGGTHLYFRQPDGARLGNTAGTLGWLIDTRGHGGYVVGPGSTVAGSVYRTTLASAPVALPAWLLALAAGREKAAASGGGLGNAEPSPVRLAGSEVGPEWCAGVIARAVADLRGHPGTPGGRNALLNRTAYSLGGYIGAGLLDRAVVAEALNEAVSHWAEDWTGRDTAHCIRTSIANGERKPRVPAPREQRRRAE